MLSIFRIIEDLEKFADQQGDVHNIDISGSVRSVVAQYNNGDFQIVQTKKVSGSNLAKNVRRKGRDSGIEYKTLFRVSVEELGLGNLEREIQEWITEDPRDWIAQNDVLYFLQQIANAKRPFLLKHLE